MCGLVGIAGDLAFKDELTMKRLLMLDYFRGVDATGLAAIRTNNDVKLSKDACGPIDLFDHGKFKEALNGMQSKAFIGHNRSATRGKVNKINSHPFESGHIVGAHNGTLDYLSLSQLEKALGEKYEVDSMALFDAIASLGIEEAIALCIEGRDSGTGAWSLVWYDTTEGTLNFLRNKHRPMYYAWTKDFKKILWASEWQMIDAAVNLAPEGSYELYIDKEGYRYFPTGENQHLKIVVNEITAGSTKVPKFKMKTIKGKEPAPVAASGHSPFVPRDFGSTASGSPETPSTSLTTKSTTSGGRQHTATSQTTVTDKINIIELFGNEENPLAGYMDELGFYEVSKYGCAWCEKPVDFTDAGISVIETQGIVLCETCSGNKSSSESSPTPTRIYVHPQTIGSLL